MAIKALTFDIVGTVFDWYSSFVAGVPVLAQKYGLTINAASYAAGSIAAYGNGVGAVNNGAPWVAPDTILHGSVSGLLPAGHPQTPAEIDEFFQLWRAFSPWPDVTEAMYALHSKYTLAILSNMSVATQTALQGHAGLPFDRTLSGETVKAYKPNPAVYQMAMASLGLQASEILMVAAHPYDLMAAKGMGMKTAYVARPQETGPNGSAPGPNPAFDYNVTSLTQLAQALGAGGPTLAEDCLPLNASAVQVQTVGAGWKVVQGAEWLLDFGASEANANRAKQVIQHYGFDRTCYVGRPQPPMMYFTVKGSSPVGALDGEDAIAFNLSGLKAEKQGENWAVTDGSSNLLSFGNNELNALHAVALIRHYGFTHVCYVGRPHAPMTYFRR